MERERNKKHPCFADTQIWVFQGGGNCKTLQLRKWSNLLEGSCHLKKVKGYEEEEEVVALDKLLLAPQLGFGI
jgi:hypothetical protein